MHCVQACIKTMLRHFNLPVLSFKELDEITGHEARKFTWMSKTLLWLAAKNLHVIHVENLDYALFARNGTGYLKTLWNNETFEIQNRYSDLEMERVNATKLTANNNVTLVNRRLNVNELRLLFNLGFFIMLSINPNVLKHKSGYASHMVVIAGFENEMVRICDPDNNGLMWYKEAMLEKAISAKRKPDFSATLVRR